MPVAELLLETTVGCACKIKRDLDAEIEVPMGVSVMGL